MAVVSTDDLMTAIRNYVGENNDDAALKLLEDATDTINSLSSTDGEDWKAKYEENDANWRKRYRERFDNGNQVRKDMTEDDIAQNGDDNESYKDDVPEGEGEVGTESLFDDVFDEKKED